MEMNRLRVSAGSPAGPSLPGPGDGPASALVESDEGKLELEGEILDVDALAKPGGVGGSAPQGEVLAADHDRAAVDAARSDHVVRRGEADEPARVVVLRLPRPLAVLAERSRVEQPVDPLADGREPAPALPRDAFRAALALRELSPVVELLDFRPPVGPFAHCCRPAPGSPAGRRVRSARASAGSSESVRAGRVRWTLELHDIAFRVVDVDGRAVAPRPVARFDGARGVPAARERLADRLLVERLHLDAEVVHVAGPARRAASGAAELAVDGNEVDEGRPGPKLHEPDVEGALDGAAQGVAIEAEHRVEVADAEHDVIETDDGDHGVHQLLRSSRSRRNTVFWSGCSGRSGNASRSAAITEGLESRKNVFTRFSSSRLVTIAAFGS